MCSYENRQTGVKYGLNHNKGQDISNFIKRNYHLQKDNVQYINIKDKAVGSKKNINKGGINYTKEKMIPNWI